MSIVDIVYSSYLPEENPVLDMEKLKCLSKEELILIAPKLEGLFNTEE